MIRDLILLIVFLTPVALSAQDQSKSGLRIENGPNQGITHIDTLGIEYNYRYNTAIITNDSTIPIHLELALSNEYDFIASCEEGKYRLFLLPKELTPDTVTLYNNIFSGLDDFLNNCLDNPYHLNKTLEAGEQQVVTIGRLTPRPPKCGVIPTKLFAKGDSLYYGTGSRSVFIPCGYISYSEPYNEISWCCEKCE